jgi:penicillin-binding protein 2
MEKRYSDRKFILIGLVFLVGITFLTRLFYIQVLSDEYALSADNNAIKKKTIYPARGIIYDRHDEILVANEVAYDLMVVPRQLKDFDTTRFCNLLNITKEDFGERISRASKYSRYKASLFLGQINKMDFAYLQETLYEFKGFYAQERTLRRYPMPIGALNLGDIGEVSKSELENDPFYSMGDYIGKSGIEKFTKSNSEAIKGFSIYWSMFLTEKKAPTRKADLTALPKMATIYSQLWMPLYSIMGSSSCKTSLEVL